MAGPPEDPLDGPLGLVGEQDVHQRPVRELDVPQGQPDAVHGVPAQPFGLGAVGAGGVERVPRAARGVGLLVLGGVQQVRQPSEQPPGLGQRRLVPRPAGQHGGVRERGGGGGLGGLGDQQHRAAGRQFALQLALAGGRVQQDRGVEADHRGAARALAVPAPGDRPGAGRDRAPGEHAVLVLDMVADLHRGERQRDGGRQPGTLAPGDRGRPHAAQRTRPGGPPAGPGGGVPGGGLGLDQHRDDQPVVVGGGPRQLPVVVAQGQAEAAEMGHPARLEPLREPVAARPDDAEHVVPPCCAWATRPSIADII